MENNKKNPATQQPHAQQHLMAHHVHPEQIYSPQHSSIQTQLSSPQQNQTQQLLQSQYHSNIDARSPLLENRQEIYGTGHSHEYTRHYGANDNYNYPQSPPRTDRTDFHTDHNVNHDVLHNIPKGYNPEVYQDYLKRNPPKDTNQIYQNQPMCRPNVNQYGSRPYLPFSNRIGPQSNPEMLRRQYNEIQQMKLQQQMHYQNQAQMHQQQKFAERQMLLQQLHGVQPPPNLQNSIYSDGSRTDLDRYNSKNDFTEYNSPDVPMDIDRSVQTSETEQKRIRQDVQKQTNRPMDFRESEWHRKQSDKTYDQFPVAAEFNRIPRNNVGIVSPLKSSESSSPSIKSPSSDSRKSSSGSQALRSPIAQRIPSAPVSMSGILYKQGSDGLKVWRKRWFVLSEYCLFYYKSQDEEKLLGSVLLPSYKVSACTVDDKVFRKFSFKLEHANMRTYVLAAPDQDSMMKWVKALTLAAVMQTLSEQSRRHSELTAGKPEDDEETPGPTYANAPPKPRRSNDGYNSPSPEMYDPNYDLLKKPGSQYSQAIGYAHYQDYSSFHTSPNQENTYVQSPQFQQPIQQQPNYQMKRVYDSHNLSLPLRNTNTDRYDDKQQGSSMQTISNPQLVYFDQRSNNNIPQMVKDNETENIYNEKSQPHSNTQNITKKAIKDSEDKRARLATESDRDETEQIHPETLFPTKSDNNQHLYNSDVYRESNQRQVRAGNGVSEQLLAKKRTDGYSRSVSMKEGNKGKLGDYEDVYGYKHENTYDKSNRKSPMSHSQETTGLSNTQKSQNHSGNQVQEKTFSGPAVLRRKKMQASGFQPQVPRPHSADFLEYESKNEINNQSVSNRSKYEPSKQPQRPKSSLDINSHYDSNSDKYYSEESYAEKMRQSVQYLLQPTLGPRNIKIPLEKYASGLVEKQLHSPYSQVQSNNYETEFGANRPIKNNTSVAKYGELEALSPNWTLKEKDNDSHKDFPNRNGSIISDEYLKDSVRFDSSTSDGFMRSASARLPSISSENEGEKKVQQREESMKRLLEWKQRMLQSPLTRKSTPATNSLARSLTQSRQSLRSDQYKAKTYTNASYNSYSSDDEASMTISGAKLESNLNNINQPSLSKKPFLGSNTSIGRNSRDANIPVRAVSPRVRWVEEKSLIDNFGSQQIMASQQNLLAMTPTDDSWATIRSVSRNSTQPVRAVSPRVRAAEFDQPHGATHWGDAELGEVPTAGQLLGRTHEELVLLLTQLRSRRSATRRALEQCCSQINSVEDSLSSLKSKEREDSLQRLQQLKMQMMDLEQQYEKSKPLVQLVDNMVKLGSLYTRPGSALERLERNQRLRQKVLAEHALEQQRWLESAAAGRPLETEAARARVAELWALERELADEAAILQGLKMDKDAIDSLLTGVRSKLDNVSGADINSESGASTAGMSAASPSSHPVELEAELARVHALLALNSKKLEQTVADNARLERELHQLRRALHARRAAPLPAHPMPHHSLAAQPAHAAHATAMLEDEVSRVQRLVAALQRQRQELSRAVGQLTDQSRALRVSHATGPVKRRPESSWQETNLDTGHTTDHGMSEYDYDVGHLLPPGHYQPCSVEDPLYVETRALGSGVLPPLSSEDPPHPGFGNLSNAEKQEIKTVRIVKRESERRQRDRERSLQPMTDWSPSNITANLDQFLEEELLQPFNYCRTSMPQHPTFSKFVEYSKPQQRELPNYTRLNEKMSLMDISPKFPSSPSLSNYDYSREMSSLSSSYHKGYEKPDYDQTISLSTQFLNSPTDSSRTLTNDPLSKTSSIGSLTRSQVELSPIFKSEAAKQIITEVSGDVPKAGSLHRRQVPKQKRRHYTAPHHLSAKTLDEIPKEGYNQDKMCRSVDDADMERALRAPPDVVRSALALAPQRLADTAIDQLLAAPQKILIPERYIPEKPPELSPEEQQKRLEKVESIKKMLSSTSADSNKSPDKEEKRQREHLLQMNQILAKQVTEMSKIIAVKALEQLPLRDAHEDDDLDRSPDVELPIYQQRDNFFT